MNITEILNSWTPSGSEEPAQQLYDIDQAYDEALQLRSEAKTMTELVFIHDRLLAILGRILGR